MHLTAWHNKHCCMALSVMLLKLQIFLFIHIFRFLGMLSPAEALSKNRKISHEPQWEYGDIGRDTEDVSTIEKEKKKPFQQSDTLKPFYMKLVKQGLSRVYKDYKSHNPFVPPKHPVRYFQRMQIPPKHVRKVIIVGAGMAGLSAAYELKKAGHQVQILEMQERVGGRVKTFGEKEGFAKGLYVDGEYVVMQL